MPMKMRYPAPSALTILKMKIDWEIRNANPVTQYKKWKNIPKLNPKAVKTPVFLEYEREFLTVIKKSGPGLITASRWTAVTVPISAKYSTTAKK
jgi:hypothetical protein